MLKVQVIMDDAKIRREKLYNVDKIHHAINSVFVDKYGLVSGENGFYFESGKKDDYVGFWGAILLLKDEDWFLSNVKTWLWFNSDDSSDPDDFAVEDLKEHYLGKIRKSA